jgi:hypothetical protein
MSQDQQRLFDEEPHAEAAGPVECLGMTFESEEARRTYFLEKLKEKLPELRKRPEFPVPEDEDILRLSDPSYDTVCPNSFMTPSSHVMESPESPGRFKTVFSCCGSAPGLDTSSYLCHRVVVKERRGHS